MSSIVSFLDSVGRNADLRHASKDQLRFMMQGGWIDPAAQAAIVHQDRSRIDALLGIVDQIHCANFSPKVPQKAPPKKPAKPAKKPARKPAKKAPAKKK